MDVRSWRGRLGRLWPFGRRRRGTAGRARGGSLAWVGVGVALAVVVVVGFVGFTRYQGETGTLDPIATRLYLTLQLFVLESGSVSGPLPWELEAARFAAPVVAAYAVLRALAAVMQAQVRRLRLALVRDHVVVAGLGRKGTLLTRALLDRGARVVAVEADAANPELATLREEGCLVVEGDARSPATLRLAGADRASRLIALCGNDGTNVEIVAAVRELADRRGSGSLHCVAHVTNPGLGVLLSVEELERYGDAPVRVDFVNVYATGTQALLGAHPPFGGQADAGTGVAVVGTGRTARHLLLALARAWADHAPEAGRRLGISVVGPDAAALDGLLARHPELGLLADVRAVADLEGLAAGRAPALAYVCPDDDDEAAAAGLELRGLLSGRPTRIVVVLEARSGLGRLLEGARSPAGGPSLVTFGLLDEACRPEALLAGTTETLARALHGAYLEAVTADGKLGDPALRTWLELPDDLRESNRDQAAHVAVKLAAVGRTLAPLTDWEAAREPFPEADVEVMSRLEHDRWMAERRKAGWRPGPRDVLARTTPYLVPWEQLAEEVRDKDRLFVRGLPRLLASVGLQAVKREGATAPDPTPVEDEGVAPERPIATGRPT